MTALLIDRGAAELHASLAGAVEALRSASHVLVVAHSSPDGDAIGSTLGAALIIEAMGPKVTRFNVDPAPDTFTFLPGAELLTCELPPETVDVTVMLDCSEPHRVGEAFPETGWGGRVVVIDHHQTVDREFADVLVHDVSAAATAELVFRLALEAGVEITTDIATCLFTALHTDTGSFRYGSTSARAMLVASHLLRTGIDAWDIASHIYEDQRPERIRLLGAALQSIERSPCGRLATMVITSDMIEAARAESSDTDGFINYARGIRGVEVAAQLTGDDDAGFRVSFRSRGRVDVASLAELFGGGGHRNAAGCTVHGTLDEVRSRLNAALVGLLDGGEAA